MKKIPAIRVPKNQSLEGPREIDVVIAERFPDTPHEKGGPPSSLTAVPVLDGGGPPCPTWESEQFWSQNPTKKKVKVALINAQI
jgi:hypothetical protein